MGICRGFANFVTGGMLDRKDARKIEQRANEDMEETNEELENARIITKNKMEEYGDLKANIYKDPLSKFISAYEIIGKVDLTPLKRSKTLDYNHFSVDIVEMKAISISIKEKAITVVGGAATGGTLAFGVMGAVSYFGIASTGTALGTLGGAAATNGTLAWLGGGAVSAGGAGMTGGMVVLGGIALAPIAVFAMFLGRGKGKQALNDAKNYSDEIDVLIEKVKTLIAELSQIRRGCEIVIGTIKALEFLLVAFTNEMNKIVTRLEQRSALSKYLIDPVKKIFDISVLTVEESEVFCASANIASLLTEIMKKPLIDENGAFVSSTLDFIENNKQILAGAKEQLMFVQKG